MNYFSIYILGEFTSVRESFRMLLGELEMPFGNMKANAFPNRYPISSNMKESLSDGRSFSTIDFLCIDISDRSFISLFMNLL